MSHMNVVSVWPKIDAKGNVSPLFQISKAPRITPFHFEAAPGTFERWEAETERIESDPESLRY
jgi:hypothetical protein